MFLECTCIGETEVQSGAQHVLNTTQIKQGAKRALLTEDSNALYTTGERAAWVYQGRSGHFERSSNFISLNKQYDTCFIYSSMLYALNITKFNWKMKFSLFLLIPLVYTLKTQYAPTDCESKQDGCGAV